MRLLDAETSESVYQKQVRPYLFQGAQRATNPRLVIVGGQPGCGKTAAVMRAASELARDPAGVVLINGDELRPFHPQYKALVKADRTTAAHKTGTDVGAWVERAIREAAAGGFSAVVETTMRQPAVVAETVRTFQGNGHQVELRALVVDPEWSQLAIYQRFAKAATNPHTLPRFTLDSYHQEALSRMPETLATVLALGASAKLLNRAGDTLADSTKEPKLVEKLQALRSLPLEPAERQRISAEWQRLAKELDHPATPAAVRAGVYANQERFAGLQQPVKFRAAGPER